MKNYLVILTTLFLAIAVNGATISNKAFNQRTLDLWLSQPANSNIKNVREIEFLVGPAVWQELEICAGIVEATKGLGLNWDNYNDFVDKDLFLKKNKTVEAGYHIINVFAAADVDGAPVLIYLTLAAFDNGKTLLKFGPHSGPYLTINQRHEAATKGMQSFTKSQNDSKTELEKLLGIMSESERKSYHYLTLRINLSGLDPRVMDKFLAPFRQKLENVPMVNDSSMLDNQPVPRLQGHPTYPFEMRRAGVRGEVVVDFIVDAKGDVQNAFAVKMSRREFESAAVECVSQWKFNPGRKDGRNVNTHMQVPIVFNPEFATQTIEPTAVDARWSNYSAYLQRMIESMQLQWAHLLSESKVNPTTGSSVTVKFVMDSKGLIARIVNVDSTAKDAAERACMNAITDRAPYGEWTDDMKAVLGEEQEMTFTFSYR